MKLSIIIPVYRVEKYLAKTLDSCLCQDVSSVEYELVVVNDGSPDGCLEIMKDYAKRYSNIVIVSQENKGLSAARNTGLKASSGTYVWFVDSDDWIAPSALATLDRYLDGKNDEIVFSGKNVMDDGETILDSRNLFTEHHGRCYTGKECWMKNIQQVSASVFAIYRSDFLRTNHLAFKEGYVNEDVEFCPKASYLSERTVYLKDCLYYVRQNPQSITRSVNAKGSFDYIVLCHDIYQFSKLQVRESCIRRKFHALIGMDINEALRQIVRCDKKKVEDFELFCHDHRQPIFSSLWKSRKLKYMLEWVLFLFSHHYASIYQALVNFKKKE